MRDIEMTNSMRTACDEIAGVLLRPGTSVLSYDHVHASGIPGSETVHGVGLHVIADRDIPSTMQDPEDAIDHHAGECWQELWYAFGSPGERVSINNAMRVA